MANNKKLNLGLCILKAWMALEVLLVHRCDFSDYPNAVFHFLKIVGPRSVPIFFIISFYFSESLIVKNNLDKFKSRLLRLWIPQVGWAIICWLGYVVIEIVCMHYLQLNLYDLLLAIVFGCRNGVNQTMWFQLVMIILTVFYFYLFKLLGEKKGMIATYITFAIAIILQATGWNYDHLCNLTFELNNTVGNIFQMMPYACLGLWFKHFNIFERFKDKRVIICVIFTVLLFVGIAIPYPAFKGFFEGFDPMHMSICLFIIFLFLPLDDVSDRTRNIIMKATRYTLGVYAAHRLVYSYLDIIYDLLNISFGSFTKCIITYLVCYLVSWIIDRIPNKYIKGLVD